MSEEENKKKGAKSKIKEIVQNKELMENLREWIIDGCFNKQIAEKLQISIETFRTMRKLPEIATFFEERKEHLVGKLENSLVKTALGFEQEIEIVTEVGEVKKIKKYHAPNVAAAAIMLKHFNKNFNQYSKNDLKKIMVEIENKELDLEIKKEELKIKQKVNNGELNFIDNTLILRANEKIKELQNVAEQEKKEEEKI